MSKRPDSLETVRIVLELLKRIPRNRKISAIELHEQLRAAGLDRDIRSIQRQLETLTEHFEIERDDRDRPYGYRWKERAEGLSLPGLNERESLLLSLAEQHLRNLLPASITKSLEAFFAQARSNLGPLSKARREREWLSKVRVVSTTQPLLPPKIIAGVFEQVSNALFGNFWLAVTYRNASGKSTKADVMPLGLAQQGPRLYLVGRFRGFDDDRSLALHRISAARATSLTFERPSEFDLRRFDDEGRFTFGAGKQTILTFRIEKSAGLHLLETPLSTDQIVRELPLDYEITATVTDTDQLTWWLRSFAGAITAIRKRTVTGGVRKQAQVRGRNASSRNL
jgi:predicted DNA-binding transcriptional regulator YafY